MLIGQLCTRQVVIASREASVAEAAKLMRQHHVGDVVVTDRVTSAGGGRPIPLGIVTDRDIVLEVLAQDLDVNRLAVGDIMSRELVTVRDRDGVFETIQLMRTKGIRRAPVVDAKGALIGIVSVDDLLELLAQELGELAKLISKEQHREVEMRVSV